MTDTATTALMTAGASLLVAFFSGWVTLRNRSKTDANSFEIQSLKGTIDKDLEKLRAKLSHGQVISSTQWNAEFGSYQAIWKNIVAVRTKATKIVFREGELTDLGLPEDYLVSADRIKNRRALLSKLVEASQGLLLAIHENAPFYPASIREAAGDVHAATLRLIRSNLTILISLDEGIDSTRDEWFISENKTDLEEIFNGVERVESSIRDRLAAIEVMNNARV